MDLNAAAARGIGHPREHLAFRLGAREYGIDVLKVQEIRGYEAPTRVANAPSFVRGVVNLRGAPVTIVDLRLRFGVGRAECAGLGVVIVANLGGRLTGLVVDSVSEVLRLPSDAVHTGAEVQGVGEPGCIEGLGVLGDRRLFLVDVERLVATSEAPSADRRARSHSAG